MKKNLLTGWATTALGAIIMIAATLDFFGVLEIPAPEGVEKFTQIWIAFVVGLVLFIMPKSFIEGVLSKVVGSKVQ